MDRRVDGRTQRRMHPDVQIVAAFAISTIGISFASTFASSSLNPAILSEASISSSPGTGTLEILESCSTFLSILPRFTMSAAITRSQNLKLMHAREQNCDPSPARQMIRDRKSDG